MHSFPRFSSFAPNFAAGDRPTVFLEIIQRVGCEREVAPGKVEQAGGCGGFGKGNFSALFKSIEDYEKTLKA